MDWNDLVRRVREGDPDAADELYQRLRPVLLPTIRQMLATSRAQRSIDASEVIQTTLRRLLDSPESPTNALKWLRKVAINVVKETGRSSQVSKTRNSDFRTEMEQVAPSPSPLDQLSDEEWISSLLAQFRVGLPPEVYQSFIYRSEGKSWAEVTELCAPADTSVEAWRKRCSRKAREIWRADDVENLD